MGINNVIEQKRAESMSAPYGGGAFDQQGSMRQQRTRRGALNTPQQTSPTRSSIERQLLILNYVVAGLVAVNGLLLMFIAGRMV